MELGPAGGLGAVRDVELAVDVGEVELDRLLGDPELLGELGVRVPLCDEPEDLELAARQLGDVAAAVGRVFGVEPDEVVSHLSTRGPLIILDNCEHVLPGAAAFVTTLLGAAPNVRVLATSREPLNVGGEVQLPLTPLPIDDAVKLFEDRAVSVNPAFDSDLELVADVCERLDGLPLAIELAAARTKALPVGDIAARLDNRFSLLRTGSRSAAPQAP